MLCLSFSLNIIKQTLTLTQSARDWGSNLFLFMSWDKMVLVLSYHAGQWGFIAGHCRRDISLKHPLEQLYRCNLVARAKFQFSSRMHWMTLVITQAGKVDIWVGIRHILAITTYTPHIMIRKYATLNEKSTITNFLIVMIIFNNKIENFSLVNWPSQVQVEGCCRKQQL